MAVVCRIRFKDNRNCILSPVPNLQCTMFTYVWNFALPLVRSPEVSLLDFPRFEMRRVELRLRGEAARTLKLHWE